MKIIPSIDVPPPSRRKPSRTRTWNDGRRDAAPAGQAERNIR